MYITYNNGFNWYYGTDGNPGASQFDLVTVVLHEICHGLNFTGSMSYDAGTGRGSWGYDQIQKYPNVYDRFMRDGSGTRILDTSVYPNQSSALGGALRSNNVWFHGDQAMAANGNQRVKMYTPSSWQAGSSYAHLDYSTFNDSPDQLMVYAVSAGESVHDPGAITKGLLADVGWNPGAAGPTVQFGAAASSAAESTPAAVINVTLSAPSSQTVTGELCDGRRHRAAPAATTRRSRGR